MITELVKSEEDAYETEDLDHENVSDFKYLWATLGTKNDWSKEMSILKYKAQKAVVRTVKNS